MITDQTTRDTLSPEERSSLLDRLLLWLVRSVKSMEKPFVTKKICTSLVAYFLRPQGVWKYCVRHLVHCFSIDDVVPFHVISQNPVTAELVMNLNHFHLMTTLWFSTILVEEVGNTDASRLNTWVSDV